ncbi:C-type lectin domain family 2 member B-like [Carettochelys insculpta]|uniref:C-type lectin domain family 2 member B-like n=1 Tax=Carettochelys insculpta TaxID=44489 RepID=UPI003EBD0BD1
MDSEQPLNEREGSLPRPKPRQAAGLKAGLIIGLVLAAIVLIAVFLAVLLLACSIPGSQLPSVPDPAQRHADCPGACCLDGWVGYSGKCYYFSEHEGTWDASQSFCSSRNASLAGIDTQKDLTFIMRYKGISEHWIGLKRVPAQPWRWVNGEELKTLFTVKGEGDCAYLSDGFTTSSWCSTKRYWICSKPEEYEARTQCRGTDR